MSRYFHCCAVGALVLLATALLPAIAQQPRATTTDKAPSAYDRKYALVIGNADYKYLPKLSNPRNDAKDMCSTLKQLGFETMCYENQRSKREMKDAVIRFSQKLAENKGVALVFYAGHGMQVKGENYLIPAEAELRSEADMDDEALSVNYLMAQLDNSKNPFNVVILDACRDDPVSRGWRSANRGLAQIDAPVGSVIIFATSPGKKASDGLGRNGLFTKHLLANLTAPGLSLEEMIKQVSRGVTEESSKAGESQTPWWNSSFTGTFCFGGCINTPQINELKRIRDEKAQLESDVARIRKESTEKQDVLATQEARSRARQTELESRIRQLETESQTASRQSTAVEELSVTKKQLEQLQNERLKQEAAQRAQQVEMQQLLIRGKELDQKTAEIEAMSRKLADLEREKLEKDRQLDEERAKKKPSDDNKASPSRGRAVDIPPVL